MVIGTSAIPIMTIPDTVCEGQMTFIKRTTGDTVYIGLRGKIPSSTNYDVILDDVGTVEGPAFTEEGIVPGIMTAIGSAATSKLSVYISYSLKQ